MKKILTLFVFVMCALSAFSATKVDFSLLETEVVVVPAETFEISAKFSIAKGWHIYGEKTQIGLPTKISATLPKGFVLEDIKFPKTKKFEFMSILSDGYSGEIIAKIKIKAPDKSFKIPQKLDFKASWLACADTCVPEEKSDSVIVIETIAKETPSQFNPLLASIFGAILGGLILNIMPCVFPVISLKVMSFASSSGDSKLSIALNGAIFSIGIISSFAVLSFILACLKAFDNSLGWGFQLQNPSFTLFMVGVFWLISLSFIGLWEFGSAISTTASNSQTLTHKNKYVSSLFSGILAVLVASPCVAPFMASAVGFALASEASAIDSVLVITSVGLGMAIPYIILAIFPSLVKKLPKPGRWLDILKKLLSIPMLLTVFWLLVVYKQQGGSMFRTSMALVMLAIGAYIWGKYANILNKKITRIKAVLICVILAFSAFMTAKIYTQERISENTQIEGNAWSAQKVEELIKSGKAVFVDFTASWCLTCQYNKQIINSAKVKKLFESNNITIIVADWTNKNAEIGNELRKYGRAGVPLYLLISPKDPKKPIILPSVLTQSIIVEAVDKIKQ